MLSAGEKKEFQERGLLLCRDAVDAAELTAMRREIALWIEQSRAHKAPFGPPTLDGRPRFDMGAEHSPERPALRRVNNPSDIAPAFEAVMREAALVDMVADLIGPDVKFHHCKINLKLPGSETEVGYHQDFAYTPHTNRDIVTALILLDDMTEENGCLTVVPGSHRGPLHSLFAEGRFTGFVAADVAAEAKRRAEPVLGPAGSVCLMHTSLLHGSAANSSAQSRGLYICVYTAADAFPLAPNPMPNPNEGSMVRGQKSRVARLDEGLIELPEQPKMASFFAVQGQASAGEGKA
jgi:ectoine hydroxylase-related dioxygenase (phytanoyl-CoA dioxygenase family)